MEKQERIMQRQEQEYEQVKRMCLQIRNSIQTIIQMRNQTDSTEESTFPSEIDERMMNQKEKIGREPNTDNQRMKLEANS